MDNRQEYTVTSLELHLFFARIMKEHAFFLQAGFLPVNAALAREAQSLMGGFEQILARAIALSNGVVRCCVLDSGEVVTDFTDCAERQTQRLTGIRINRELTARAARLRGRSCEEESCAARCLRCRVRRLNRDALDLVNRLIAFKERLLRQVGCCRLFTANYPLLIEHILREAKLYRTHLLRLTGGEDCGCQNQEDSRQFWNQIMMEHALFIRGLLDPTEEALIEASNGFAADFRRLLEAPAANSKSRQSCPCDTLELTRKFRDFNREGAEGIQACKIRSLILPLLADHVLREANHNIRLQES